MSSDTQPGTAGFASRAAVPKSDESPLSLDLVDVPPDSAVTFGQDEADTLIYVYRGDGEAAVSGTNTHLQPGSALFIEAGSATAVTSGDSGLAIAKAYVGDEAPLHATLGEPEWHVVTHGVTRDAATSNRAFETIFGPHNGSCRATLFLGFVPPGPTPWHYHFYDEIVWILDGDARHHIQGGVRKLNELEAVRIHPKEIHMLENVGDSELVLIGLFTPAGSPSAAYLPPSKSEVSKATSF